MRSLKHVIIAIVDAPLGTAFDDGRPRDSAGSMLGAGIGPAADRVTGGKTVQSEISEVSNGHTTPQSVGDGSQLDAMLTCGE
jgi:hypothetical protein